MVLKVVLGSFLIAHANAAHWALLAAGSKDYENYRHQADLCHAYHILVSKGFSRDRIITMAYDDIANNSANPFPGQIFNAPSPNSTGIDVYKGCNLDYTGDAVTADNFRNLLLGTNTTGGNGRKLNTGPADHLTVLYFDHGGKGLVQFPAGDPLHAADLNATLRSMHESNRYGKMVIRIAACYSGSMVEDLPSDMNIYAVTAVPDNVESRAAWCFAEAVVNGTHIGACLSDLFPAFYMKFIEQGNGSHTLNQFFQNVSEDVASYAALHCCGQEENQRYGDLSMGDMKVSDFFYGDSQSDIELAAPFSTPWIAPVNTYSASSVAMQGSQWEYNEASAKPTYHGENHWMRMLQATDALSELLHVQKYTQKVYWDLVKLGVPDNTTKWREIWTSTAKPSKPQCELQVRAALLDACHFNYVTTSYALQFHQVVVNLCAYTAWGANPDLGIEIAHQACNHTSTPRHEQDGFIV